MSAITPLSSSKLNISDAKRILSKLKSENSEYTNSLSRLIESTKNVLNANSRLEKGISERTKYKSMLGKNVEGIPDMLRKYQQKYHDAFRRFKKYQRQASKQKRGATLRKIRKEIDDVNFQITMIKNETEEYQNKVKLESDVISQIIQLNGLKRELVTMNKSLREEAYRLLGLIDFAHLDMPEKVEEQINILRTKMMRADFIKKKLDMIDNPDDDSYDDSKVYADIDDRLKQTVHIFKDLESVFQNSTLPIASLNYQQNDRSNSENVSEIVSEIITSGSSLSSARPNPNSNTNSKKNSSTMNSINKLSSLQNNGGNNMNDSLMKDGRTPKTEVKPISPKSKLFENRITPTKNDHPASVLDFSYHDKSEMKKTLSKSQNVDISNSKTIKTQKGNCALNFSKTTPIKIDANDSNYSSISELDSETTSNNEEYTRINNRISHFSLTIPEKDSFKSTNSFVNNRNNYSQTLNQSKSALTQKSRNKSNVNIEQTYSDSSQENQNSRTTMNQSKHNNSNRRIQGKRTSPTINNLGSSKELEKNAFSKTENLESSMRRRKRKRPRSVVSSNKSKEINESTNNLEKSFNEKQKSLRRNNSANRTNNNISHSSNISRKLNTTQDQNYLDDEYSGDSDSHLNPTIPRLLELAEVSTPNASLTKSKTSNKSLTHSSNIGTRNSKKTRKTRDEEGIHTSNGDNVNVHIHDNDKEEGRSEKYIYFPLDQNKSKSVKEKKHKSASKEIFEEEEDPPNDMTNTETQNPSARRKKRKVRKGKNENPQNNPDNNSEIRSNPHQHKNTTNITKSGKGKGIIKTPNEIEFEEEEINEDNNIVKIQSKRKGKKNSNTYNNDYLKPKKYIKDDHRSSDDEKSLNKQKRIKKKNISHANESENDNDDENEDNIGIEEEEECYEYVTSSTNDEDLKNNNKNRNNIFKANRSINENSRNPRSASSPNLNLKKQRKSKTPTPIKSINAEDKNNQLSIVPSIIKKLTNNGSDDEEIEKDPINSTTQKKKESKKSPKKNTTDFSSTETYNESGDSDEFFTLQKRSKSAQIGPIISKIEASNQDHKSYANNHIYDSDGQIIENVLFIKENGSPSSVNRVFNSKGNEIQSPIKFNNSQINSKVFDDNGNQYKSAIKIDENGKTLDRNVYDKYGNKIEDIFSYLSKQGPSKVKKIFDKEGRSLNVIPVDQNGNLISKTAHYYDSENNEIIGPFPTSKSGLLNQKLYDDKNKAIDRVVRVDENGKLIDDIYNENGEPISDINDIFPKRRKRRVRKNRTLHSEIEKEDEDSKIENSKDNDYANKNHSMKNKVKSGHNSKKGRFYGKNGQELHNIIFVDKNSHQLLQEQTLYNSQHKEVEIENIDVDSKGKSIEKIYDANNCLIDCIVMVDLTNNICNPSLYNSNGEKINDILTVIKSENVRKPHTKSNTHSQMEIEFEEEEEVGEISNGPDIELEEEEEIFKAHNKSENESDDKSDNEITHKKIPDECNISIFDDEGNEIVNKVFVDQEGKPFNKKLFNKNHEELTTTSHINSNSRPSIRVIDENGDNLKCIVVIGNNGEILNPVVYNKNGKKITKIGDNSIIKKNKSNKPNKNKAPTKIEKQKHKKTNDIDFDSPEEKEVMKKKKLKKVRTVSDIDFDDTDENPQIKQNAKKKSKSSPVNNSMNIDFDSTDKPIQNNGNNHHHQNIKVNHKAIKNINFDDESYSAQTDESMKVINRLKKEIKTQYNKIYDVNGNEIKNPVIIDSHRCPTNISVFDSKGNEIRSAIESDQELFDCDGDIVDHVIEVDRFGRPTNTKICDSKGNNVNDLSYFFPRKNPYEESASLVDSENHYSPHSKLKLNRNLNNLTNHEKSHYKTTNKNNKPLTATLNAHGKPLDFDLFDSSGNEISEVIFDINGSPIRRIFDSDQRRITSFIIENGDSDDAIDIFYDAEGNEYPNPVFVDIRNIPFNNVKLFDSQGRTVTGTLKYDDKTGIPINQIFDAQGKIISHVVQIGDDGIPTKLTLYNMQKQPVMFPVFNMNKSSPNFAKANKKMIFDKKALNIVSYDNPVGDEEEDYLGVGDEKPSHTSKLKWTRAILSNVINNQLDRTKLNVDVADAKLALARIEDEIRDLEDEKIFLEKTTYEYHQMPYIHRDVVKIFIPGIGPPDLSDMFKHVHTQSETTNETVVDVLREIDENTQFLAKYIIIEQQKLVADSHFPELEKVYRQLRKNNSKLQKTIEGLEARLNLINPDENAEHASKETRLRVKFEENRNEKQYSLSQIESQISEGSIQINDLKNRIEDQRVLIEMIKKKLAEQQRKERPNTRNLCLKLDGLRNVDKRNREKLKMLDLESLAVDLQAARLFDMLGEKSIEVHQSVVDEGEKQLAELKEMFSRMIKKDRRKRNPTTNMAELRYFDEKIKEVKKQIGDIKRKENVVVNKVDKSIKTLQAYGLRIPTHYRVTNGEII
ncbi:hypothetical protein TRFO_04017 [Tritrichomonas foetus]|uniref:Uncharacterized protein n=1 Tax=Tritrichomonas foetus TaxID=1144522 RepID=A0A1J4KI75_9EUKA|nr:hypothetical protein TRFO_04017 [Tritrichomonas foetus]|eukprot:OHT11081.1 hypothetical protein TRFO_04017 [Tritrichomonas foetus]